VLPNTAPFKLNINGIDFLSDGKKTELQVFNPQKTAGTGALYFTKDIELGDTLSASFLNTSRRSIEHITL